MKLDFEQRQRAEQLLEWIDTEPEQAAYKMVALESINADLYEALELLVDTNDNGGWPSAAIVVARPTEKALEAELRGKAA